MPKYKIIRYTLRCPAPLWRDFDALRKRVNPRLSKNEFLLQVLESVIMDDADLAAFEAAKINGMDS